MDRELDPLFWRLVYPDDSTISESLTNTSIYKAKPGAVELHAVKNDGAAILRIDLRPDYKPVWYRKRGGFAVVELDATVMGKVREAEDTYDSTLWAAHGGQIVDCPTRFFDLAAVHLAATEAGNA